jgi:hypothetical protein
MQRRVDVLRVSQAAILQGVAATPTPFTGDAELEDQARAASLASQGVPNLHVAAPLARAGRDSESSEMATTLMLAPKLFFENPPSSRAPWLHLSEL